MIVGRDAADGFGHRHKQVAPRAAIAAFAARWREMPPLVGLSHALDALDAPDTGAVAALVRPVLDDAGWASGLIAALVAEVAREPLFDPPFAPLRSDVQAGLMLYDGRHAAIALGVGALDRLAAKKIQSGDGSIAFSGHETLVRVLDGGGATLSFWRGGWRDGVPATTCRFHARRRLDDGETFTVDRDTSFLVEHARRDIVLLHATIFAGAAPTACEYDRATRALRGTGATSDRASRTQMLTTLLGALDFADRLVGESIVIVAVGDPAIDALLARACDLPALHAVCDTDTPVIAIDGPADPRARARLLDAGAADVLTAPVDPVELAARLRAQARLRRSRPIDCGDLLVDPVARHAERGGRRLPLHPREFALLATLARERDRPVDRMTLLGAVWRRRFDPGTNVVAVTVSRLRAKVDHGYPRPLIHTVGSAYMLSESAVAMR